MHHIPLFALTLTLLSTASGFVLPANQPNGIYQVRRSASGDEVHEILSTPPVRRSPDASASEHHLAKRAWGHTYCGCGFDLSHSDTDAAVADLKTQLGDKGHLISPSSSYYSIRGEVVAFVCNEDGNGPLKAWKDVVGQAASQITQSCGSYVAGTTGSPFEFSIGYMKNKAGLDFCGGAFASSVGHC